MKLKLMQTFSSFFSNEIKERALNIGNKTFTQNYNQIVILCGGAGSGKGTVLNGIINLPNAKIFDVDALKTKAIKYAPRAMNDKFKQLYGHSLKSLDLTNGNDTKLLHQFMADNGYNDKLISNFLYSVGDLDFDDIPRSKVNDHKPNIVFDVTLKDINKMVQISELVQKHGYKKENIHLVWIVTDFKIALEQNSERDRKVPEDILKFTHIGANNTMYDIIHEYNKYKAYLDGDIWIIPNKRGIDNTFYQSKTSSGKTLFVLEKYKKIKLKTAGKELSISDINKQLSSEIKEKLNEYTPKDAKSGNF